MTCVDTDGLGNDGLDGYLWLSLMRYAIDSGPVLSFATIPVARVLKTLHELGPITAKCLDL